MKFIGCSPGQKFDAEQKIDPWEICERSGNDATSDRRSGKPNPDSTAVDWASEIRRATCLAPPRLLPKLHEYLKFLEFSKNKTLI